MRGAKATLTSELTGTADQASKSFGSRFGAGVKSALARAGKVTLAGAGIAAGVALTSGFKSAIDQQTGQKTLAGLYGSADKAAAMMSSLRQVSKSSPIDYSSYVEAAQSLAYAGVEGDQATSVLKNVGLAIVATGGTSEHMDRATDAVLKMVNAGKVSLNSLQQLSNTGVPIISGLADHFGVSMDEVNKMASEGAIGLEDVVSVMENATGPTFQKSLKGAAEAIRSFGNQWKILKDNIRVAIGVGIMPALDKLAPALGSLGTAMATGIEKLPAMFAGIGKAMSSLGDTAVFQFLASSVASFGRSLADAFRAAAPAVKDLMSALAPLAKIAVAAWAISWAVQLRVLGGVIEVVAKAFSVFVGIVTNPAVAGALTAIGAGLLAAFGPALAQIVAFNVVAAITVARMTIMGAAAKVAAVGQWALNAAMTANPIGLLVAALAGLVAGLVIAYKKSATFRAIVNKAFGVVRKVVGTVIGFLAKVVPATFKTIASVVRAATATVRKVVTGAWNAIRSATSKVFNAVRKVVTSVWSAIRSAVGKAAGTARSVVTGAWNAIRSSTSKAWSSVRRAVTDGVSKVVGVLKGLPGKAKSAVGNLGSTLYNAGKDLLRGMINGVKAMAGSLASAAKNAVKGAIGKAKSLLGIRSPSRVFATIGKQTIQGLVVGLEENRKRVEAPMARVAAAMVPPEIPAPSVAAARPAGAGVYATSVAPRREATGVGPGSEDRFPRRLVLRVGEHDFVGYLEQVTDARLEAGTAMVGERRRAAWQS